MAQFTQETWRDSAAVKLGEIGRRLKMFGQVDLPYIAYGTVAGLSVWPLVETVVSTGQLSSILGALYSTAAGIGANLIANRIEAWKDGAEPPTEDEVIAWVAGEAGNTELRAALDDIVARLEAIPQALAAADDSERENLRAILLREAAQLGNLTRFESVITGGGAFIMGDASAARDLHAGAHTVGGHEIHDSTINGPVLGAGATLNQIVRDDTKPDPAALRHAYLHYVFQTTAYLTLGGVDPQAKGEAETRLALASVYTGLLTWAEQPDAIVETYPSRIERRTARSAVEELDRHARLVLLGEPGSGKSTFAGFVALCLAGEAHGDPVANLALLTAPLPDEEGNDEEKRQPWHHGAPLPALVVLRDFAAAGLPPAGQEAGVEHLWHFLEKRLGAAGIGDYAPHLRNEWLKHGGLLILDGLDEVPEADSRRAQIKQVVGQFAAAFPRCRMLVTSRTYAYQKQDWKLPGFAESVLAPFGRGQIRRFVDRWYGHIGELRGWTVDDTRGRAALLKREIEQRESLRGLAERPLLLTLMASLHAWHGTNLPDEREALYHEAVDMLLEWWERRRVVFDAQGRMVNPQPSMTELLKVDLKRVRGLLNELAFRAHSRQTELTGTADITEDELVNGLMALTDNEEVKPKLLVQYLSHRAGLLVPHGGRVFTFPHRTFQEYLAACYLTDHDYPHQVAALVRADANRWREVALLAGAKVTRGTPYAVWPLVDELCPREPSRDGDPADAWGALLAGQLLLESADLGHVSDANRAKVERVRRWQLSLLAHRALPDVERAAAGRALADLGDDRPEVMDVDAMHFCLVPGGEFWMGSDNGDKNEKPLHPNKHLTYDYWLGRYPVTNAQYDAFVQAKGYERAEFWPEAIAVGRWSEGAITDWAGTRSRPYPYGGPYSLSNHPVVGITWYEALAFTRWLTTRWRAGGLLPRGWEVRLPSEAEWEKGARGGAMIPDQPVIRAPGNMVGAAAPAMIANPDDDRVHPWTGFVGPRLANTAESAINATSATGLFPLGAGPYGCEEMAGGVWEWTRSLWGEDYQKPSFVYPYDPEEGREDLTAGIRVLRVLRGASYYYGLDSCRCARRSWFNPPGRSDIDGFRALVAPS